MRIDISSQYGFSGLAVGDGEGGERLRLKLMSPGEGGLPTISSIRRLAAKIGAGEGGVAISHSSPGEGGVGAGMIDTGSI